MDEVNKTNWPWFKIYIAIAMDEVNKTNWPWFKIYIAIEWGKGPTCVAAPSRNFNSFHTPFLMCQRNCKNRIRSPVHSTQEVLFVFNCLFTLSMTYIFMIQLVFSPE